MNETQMWYYHREKRISYNLALPLRCLDGGILTLYHIRHRVGSLGASGCSQSDTLQGRKARRRAWQAASAPPRLRGGPARWIWCSELPRTRRFGAHRSLPQCLASVSVSLQGAAARRLCLAKQSKRPASPPPFPPAMSPPGRRKAGAGGLPGRTVVCLHGPRGPRPPPPLPP